jgi:hypothetical protein
MNFCSFTMKKINASIALYYGHLLFVAETHEGEVVVTFLLSVFFTLFFYAEGQGEKDDTYTKYEAAPQKNI